MYYFGADTKYFQYHIDIRQLYACQSLFEEDSEPQVAPWTLLCGCPLLLMLRMGQIHYIVLYDCMGRKN